MEQHTISHCYLKGWCDPANLPGKCNPYIWVISKDGLSKPERKPPRRFFTEADRYTIKTRSNRRILLTEHMLKATEDAFARLRPKIEKLQPLSSSDHAHLCAFVTAMLSRPKAQGDHFREFLSGLHQIVVNLEKKRGADPLTSLLTGPYADNALSATIASAMLVVPYFLQRMRITIFTTDDEDGFITSDNPCVIFNPNPRLLPPAARTRMLNDPEVQLTVPLTPTRMLFMSYGRINGYVPIDSKDVDELNRRTRFGCSEFFVSLRGTVKDYWFQPDKQPEDSWEKSPEGIAAETQKQQWLKAKLEWEADVKREDLQAVREYDKAKASGETPIPLEQALTEIRRNRK